MDHTDPGVARLLAQWAEAIRNSDLDGLTALVSDDGEFWSNGAAPLIGRAPVRVAFERVFASFSLTQQFDCVEQVVIGDLAFMRGMERNTLHPRDGSPVIHQMQRAFSIARRETDGHWRFWRGMTNTPPTV